MTIARRNHLRLEVTPYYHCVTRCVRRAFICGQDQISGRNFSHRKDWIEQRLLLLSQVFCIDIAGYAIMSNHYHLVLHVNQKQAAALTDDEVINRWHKLYKGPEVIRRYIAKEPLAGHELAIVHETINLWRDQLSNLSRFMGNLNQTIARRANKEDQCKGRFWESRFKLQAILDVKALLRTLCYVDLNPVRANTATSPETSQHTSVKRRLTLKTSKLMPFASSPVNSYFKQNSATTEIPIDFNDYLTLLDYTGREIKKGKRGFIDSEAPPILVRLGISTTGWAKAQKPALTWMQRAIGSAVEIKKYCDAIGQQWIWQEVR